MVLLEGILYWLYSGIGSCVILCHFVFIVKDNATTMEPVLRRLVLDWCGDNAPRLRDEPAIKEDHHDRPTLVECTNQSGTVVPVATNNSHSQPPAILYSQDRQEQSLRDYKVTIEYKHLKSHAPGGVYLVPSMDDLRHFYGVIFVRRGPYTNGIFKFELSLPKLYNSINQHPKITFVSHVYNPFVTTDGVLDIQTAYPKWDPSKHYLVTVLTFLKKIFYAKDFDNAVANPDAKELFSTNPTLFRAKVEECVEESQKNMYNNNSTGGALTFSADCLNHHVLRELLKENVKDPSNISKNAIIAMIDKASKE